MLGWRLAAAQVLHALQAGSFSGAACAAGRQRRWDMVSSHSSVGIVLYHTSLDALLLVRQFRPAVSICRPPLHALLNDRHATTLHADQIQCGYDPWAQQDTQGLSGVNMHACSSQDCTTHVMQQVYASRWRQATEDGRPQPPLSAGFTYELCAGIIDKSKSLEDIAREEVPSLWQLGLLPLPCSVQALSKL
jgi:hypothetical protein